MKTGICISSVIRDILIDKGIIFPSAQDIAEEIDNKITKEDWLETFNGTTFEKTFTPKGKEND